MVHLWLWLGCTLLAFFHENDYFRYAVLLSPTEDGGVSDSVVYLVVSAISAAFSAIALATVFVWLRRWLRGVPFPNQPGEWLLIAGGVSLWADMFVDLTIGNLYYNYVWQERINIIFNVAYAFILIVGAVRLLSRRKSLPGIMPWSVVLISVAATALMSLVRSHDYLVLGISFLTFVPICVAVGSFIMAANNDFQFRRRRGWLHLAALHWIAGTIIVTIVQYAVFANP